MRRMMAKAVWCSCALLVLTASTGGAITGGQPDEGRHPQVGGTVLYDAARDTTFVNCTGTLISSAVFLTAAHCGRHDTRRRVTFDEVFDPSTSQTHSGRFYAHPDYDPSNPALHDVAVIMLDRPVAGIAPAQLPTAGLLDGMRANGTLNQSTQFTAVGYGFLGYTMDPGGPTRIRGQSRHYAVGSFDALTSMRLHLSQNPALDDGGTCNGDSGGPNFLGAGPGETTVIAGITSTGDTYCRATNVTYRLDIESVRAFLGKYVPLP